MSSIPFDDDDEALTEADIIGHDDEQLLSAPDVLCSVAEFVWRSTGRGAAEFYRDRGELDQRATAVGTAGQTAPQRRDRAVRTAVPRSKQPGRRLADQHHRDVHRY